jgi:hypothetical protein
MRTEIRMSWAAVLGLSVAVVIAAFVYAVALVVMDDADQGVDVDDLEGGFDGDQLSEFD